MYCGQFPSGLDGAMDYFFIISISDSHRTWYIWFVNKNALAALVSESVISWSLKIWNKQWKDAERDLSLSTFAQDNAIYSNG
jgi:hypothetical protein